MSDLLCVCVCVCVCACVCVHVESPNVQYIKKDPYFPCHWLLLCFISVAAAAFARFPASGFQLHLPL